MMRNLPLDYSRCENSSCQHKETCLRWLTLEEPFEKYIVISHFTPFEEGCDFKIEKN